MEKGSWFWIFWVLAILSFFGWTFLPEARRPYGGAAFGLFVLIFSFILGLAQFGAIAK